MSEDDGAAPTLSRSVKAGVAWSTLTFAITKGLSFLSLLVLTRVLAPSQFGLVAAVVVVISIIELTSDLGMAATVIYEQESGLGERVDVAFTVNMVFVVVLAAVGFIAAPAIASFFHAPGHVGLFRLSMLDVLLTGLGVIHDGLLLRDMRFSARIVTQVVSGVVRASTGVALALLGLGAASLVWGLLAGTAAWTLALWWVTRFRPTLRFNRPIAASMIGYGIGASTFSFFDQIVGTIDTAVVGRVLGKRALGLYTVAFRIPTLVLQNIANQVSLVAFPALARKRVTDAAGVGASAARLVRYEALYALPLAAGMAVMARPIVTTVFSSKWQSASGVFAAVSVMSGISAAGFALGDALKAVGRQRLLVLLLTIQFPLLLVTIILIAPYGITAVAWARAAGEASWVTLVTLATGRVLNMPISVMLGALWPGTAASVGVVLSAGAVRLFSGLAPVPQIVAAVVAGCAGGAMALALLSPAAFREVLAMGGGAVAHIRSMRPPRRASRSQLGEAGLTQHSEQP